MSKSKRKKPTAEKPRLGRKPLNEDDPLIHVGFRLPTSIVEKLDRYAEKSGQKKSEYIRDLLEAAIRRLR